MTQNGKVEKDYIYRLMSDEEVDLRIVNMFSKEGQEVISIRKECVDMVAPIYRWATGIFSRTRACY